MIMVLGRAVRESEAEFHLRTLRGRKAPRKPLGKHVEERLDDTKVKVKCSRPETRDSGRSQAKLHQVMKTVTTVTVYTCPETAVKIIV